MPDKFVRSKLKKATVPVVMLQLEPNNNIKAITEDGMCFLLDRATKRCTSYKDRPYICHLYGKNKQLLCPYVNIAGNPRSIRDEINIKAHQQLSAARLIQDDSPRPFFAVRR
jgi:Fe-S-cluster containining protein